MAGNSAIHSFSNHVPHKLGVDKVTDICGVNHTAIPHHRYTVTYFKDFVQIMRNIYKGNTLACQIPDKSEKTVEFLLWSEAGVGSSNIINLAFIKIALAIAMSCLCMTVRSLAKRETGILMFQLRQGVLQFAYPFPGKSTKPSFPFSHEPTNMFSDTFR